MIGNGNIFSDSVSPFGAVISLSIENSKVFEGVCYSLSRRLSIGGSAVVDIVFDPSASTDKNFIVFLPVTFKAYGAGPINIDLYVNPTYTGGAAMPFSNRDFTSQAASDVVWTLNPTVSDAGTLTPFQFIILSNGTAAVASAGGEASENQVTNIDISKKYMFRLTNTEAAAVTGASIAATWFEVK